MNEKIVLSNIDKIHTTKMDIDKFEKNLKIDTNDVVDYCKNWNIYKQGNNWCFESGDIWKY